MVAQRDNDRVPGTPPSGEEDELEHLTRELYTREEPADIKQRREVLHWLGLQEHERTKEEADLARAQFKNLALQRARRFVRILRLVSILVGVVAVIIWALVVTTWYRRTKEVVQSDIVVSIDAPQEFTAGEEIVYHIAYGNKSRVDWHDVELVFEVPKGFRFIDSSQQLDRVGRQYVYRVGNLARGAQSELTIAGQLIGEQNEAAVARAELLLTPSNFPSGRFSNVAAFSTTITALSLEVALDIPNDAASGERVLATISVRNLSSKHVEGGYLRMRAAPGIQLAVEDPDFSPGFSTLDSEWRVPTLSPLEGVTRTLVLYSEGRPGEQRVLEIEAGIRQGDEEFTQRMLSPVITLSASELLVDLLYNGSSELITVRPGETVAGTIRYQNVGTVGLKDVIVEVQFVEGVGFDPSLLTHRAGAYDPIGRKVVWSPATVPELAVVQPHEVGDIAFNFRVLSADRFPKSGENAKNIVIVSTATVDSPDLPAPVGQPRRVVSDRAVIALRGDLTLAADALYDDGRLGLRSSGPLPPTVGQTTTYTLRFRVGSTLNDTGDIRMVGVLPDGVRHTGAIYKTVGDVQYNERSGEIVWTIPLVDGLAGRARPPGELHLQVAITPGENKRGQAIVFLNKLQAEGVDQFTDETVTASVGTFPSTATAVPGKGQVQ